MRFGNRGQITEHNISYIYLLRERERLVSVLGTELLEIDLNSFSTRLLFPQMSIRSRTRTTFPLTQYSSDIKFRVRVRVLLPVRTLTVYTFTQHANAM